MAKKYRIIDSFTYRGPDGKSQKSVVLAPGEEVPKLDSDQRESLLRRGKICEVDQYGANIRYKEMHDLTDEQIDGLLKKPHPFIMQYLAGIQGSTRPFSKETLSKLYSLAEQKKLPLPLIKQLEKFIEE